METVEEGSKSDEKMEVDTSATQDTSNTPGVKDVIMEDNREVVHEEEKMSAENKGSKDEQPSTSESMTEGATPVGAAGSVQPSTSESKTEGATPFCAPGSSTGSGIGNERKELPFQLQIVYTDTEGAKALRVMTHTKPITRDRRKAEKSRCILPCTLFIFF